MDENNYQRLSKNRMGLPLCDFCLENEGIERIATHLAQQYALGEHKDKTTENISHWAFCCEGHVTGWNEGSNYLAIIFELKDSTSRLSFIDDRVKEEKN